MITQTIESYWIPSQNKLQIYRICPKFKFWNLSINFTRNTPSEVAWYEMDPASIVENTGQTRFCPQMNRRTDGQTDKVKPVYPPSTLLSSGYDKPCYIIHDLHDNEDTKWYESHKSWLIKLQGLTAAVSDKGEKERYNVSIMSKCVSECLSLIAYFRPQSPCKPLHLWWESWRDVKPTE